ncbi:MAG: DNA cytosine methyltransferase [Bacteroidales bacterium]|jgi:DNA (cytosine-5)-methyltransferase 1|nr:DNA cytosine methyltransferase [Bacteroidales bacterium]
MARISDFAVVDLFCGIGGLSHGFIKEQLTVSAGVDFDDSCRYAYEKNNNAKFLHKDVTELSPSELNSLYPENKRKILVGCAPCQPFSIFNYKNNNNAEKQEKDKKWQLLYSFANLIEATQPEIISMENVPQLKTFNNGQVFNDFVKCLRKNGYKVSYNIHNAQDYGVPQRRKRLILLASKHSNIELIPPTHSKGNYITVRQAISHLQEVKDGEHCKNDFVHYPRKLANITKERIKATPEGGGWQDWDESLLLECHKKEGGQMYRSVYGRMSWDDVAPTVTTYCIGLNNGRFGHPEQDRAISLREAAILQSFPENYDLIEPDTTFRAQILARHIGNAVPVGLGQAIARSIKNHIKTINE